MPGINSKHGAFGGIPGVAMKSRDELADLLGTHPQTISATKSLSRGMSPELAKSVATKSGEKAATLYASSQIASIKARIAAEKMSPSGALSAIRDITSNLRGQFAEKDFDRNSAEFQSALLQIKEVAQSALDLGGNVEPVNDVNSGVTAVAAKSRDLHGRRANRDDEEKIERWPDGSRVKD